MGYMTSHVLNDTAAWNESEDVSVVVLHASAPHGGVTGDC